MLSKKKKELLKNQILTNLWNSGVMHKKMESAMFRYHVSLDTYIQDDILSEVFMHLSRKTADYILEIHNRDPKKIIGLAVRILVLKGFSKNPKKGIDYPKNNLLDSILFASNLKQNKSIDTTETFHDVDGNTNEFNNVLVGVSDSFSQFEEDGQESQFITDIRLELTNEENQQLTAFIERNEKAKLDKGTTVLQEKLFHKIKTIIQNN